MADIWIDYAGGDDVGGTGAMANPFKTLDVGTAGINPNDHVKLVEGPANTALAGTFSWTDESTAVVSSVDHSATGTGLLVVGDYIGKNTAGPPGDAETYWEITVITGVNITIKAKYVGTTDGTAVTEKLGVIDVTLAPNVGQKMMSSGTLGNPIIVSGGWNKTTGLRTGETWWRAMVASNRGIDTNAKSYITIEHIGILKFIYGILYWGYTIIPGLIIDTVSITGTTGIRFFVVTGIEICNFCCSQNSTAIDIAAGSDDLHIHHGNIYSTNGITLVGMDGATVDNIFMYLSMGGGAISLSGYATHTTIRDIDVEEYGTYVIDLTNVGWTTIENITGYTNDVNSWFLGIKFAWGLDVDGITSEFVGNLSGQRHITDGSTQCGKDINISNVSLKGGYFGIIFAQTHYGDVVFSDVAMDNITRGIQVDRIAQGIVVNKYRPTAVATDVYFVGPNDQYDQRSELPYVKCQSFINDGEHRSYYGGQAAGAAGVISMVESDTAEAISGYCSKFSPQHTDWWMRQSFFTKAEDSVAKDLSISIKEDAGSAFTGASGEVEAAIYFNQKRITGWTAWVPTTSWVEKTITAAAIDIYEDGVLELRVRVKGTAGNVYIDGFSAT